MGLFDPHVEMLRTAYRARRDRSALRWRGMPAGCRWQRPGGGFFVWLRLPEGMDSAALLPQAEAAGVSYVPGTRFYADGRASQHLRLAFTMLPLEELEEGVRGWRGGVLDSVRRSSCQPQIDSQES